MLVISELPPWSHSKIEAPASTPSPSPGVFDPTKTFKSNGSAQIRDTDSCTSGRTIKMSGREICRNLIALEPALKVFFV